MKKYYITIKLNEINYDNFISKYHYFDYSEDIFL